MLSVRRAGLALVLALVSGAANASDEPARPNNGTDPTRIPRIIETSFEHVDFGAGTADTAAIAFVQPFGPMAHSSFKVRMPFGRNSTAGGGYALGDLSIRFTQVVHSEPKQAFALWAELIFDTAARPELGTGKTVLKSKAIYARFLDNGTILAPTLQHEAGLAGDSSRADISITTFNFYVVPKLANPRLFMTIEPAAVADWENDRRFASFATTFGLKLGRALGGDLQLTAKPSLFLGAERPANGSIEVGLQLLNF